MMNDDFWKQRDLQAMRDQATRDGGSAKVALKDDQVWFKGKAHRLELMAVDGIHYVQFIGLHVQWAPSDSRDGMRFSNETFDRCKAFYERGTADEKEVGTQWDGFVEGFSTSLWMVKWNCNGACIYRPGSIGEVFVAFRGDWSLWSDGVIGIIPADTRAIAERFWEQKRGMKDDEVRIDGKVYQLQLRYDHGCYVRIIGPDLTCKDFHWVKTLGKNVVVYDNETYDRCKDFYEREMAKKNLLKAGPSTAAIKKGTTIMSKSESTIIDGVKYIREDLVSTPSSESANLKYCIVRSREQGVMSGFLVKVTGRTVKLIKARQLWKWDSSFVLPDLAESGVRNTEDCKFSEEMSEPMLMLEACGILFCTEEATQLLRSVSAHNS